MSQLLEPEPNHFEVPMEEPASIDRLHQEMNRRMSSVRKKVQARVIKVLNKYAVSPQVNQGDRRQPG